MTDPKLGGDTYVAEEGPQLGNRAEADRSDGEQPNPLAAYDSTEGETSKHEPRPPALTEWVPLVLITEANPEECGKGGEE